MKIFKQSIIIFLLLPMFLFADIGKITVVSGDVSIIRGQKIIKAFSGSLIEEKDQVVTKSGSAQLRFADGTTISVGNKTTFKVEEFIYDETKADKNNVKAKFGVAEGAFKAVTGKIGKINPDKFKLETRTATIGIRGTRFLGIVPAKGPETIACTYGRIVLTLKPIEIKAPLGLAQPQGQAPTAPAPASQAPSQPSTAPAPIGAGPAPQAPAVQVEVKAGEMTTVNVGRIDAPKAYTPAQINTLEKATASTDAKKSDPATGTTSTASPASTAGDNKGGDNGGGNNNNNQGSTTSSSSSQTQSGQTVSNQSAQPSTPLTSAASSIQAPTVNMSSITSTIANVQSTVNNVVSTQQQQTNQDAVTKAAIDAAYKNKDFEALANYLNDPSYSSLAASDINSIIAVAGSSNDFTTLLNAASSTAPLVSSTAQSAINTIVSTAINTNDKTTLTNLVSWLSSATLATSQYNTIVNIVSSNITTSAQANMLYPIISTNSKLSSALIGINSSYANSVSNAVSVAEHTANINNAISNPTQANLAVVVSYLTDTSWSAASQSAINTIVSTAISTNDKTTLTNLVSWLSSATLTTSQYNTIVNIVSSNITTSAQANMLYPIISTNSKLSSALMGINSSYLASMINTAIANKDLTTLGLLSQSTITTVSSQASIGINTAISTAWTNKDYATMNSALTSSYSSIQNSANAYMSNIIASAWTNKDYPTMNSALTSSYPSIQNLANNSISNLVASAWTNRDYQAMSGMLASSYLSVQNSANTYMSNIIASAQNSKDASALNGILTLFGGVSTTVNNNVLSALNQIIANASSSDVGLLASAKLSPSASIMSAVDAKLNASHITSDTVYTVIPDTDTGLATNALKVTYGSTTEYFKYTTNTNSYGTDVTFNSISDLTTKLEAFTGGNVKFYIDPTTNQVSYNILSTAQSISVDKVYPTDFLGVSNGDYMVSTGALNTPRSMFGMTKMTDPAHNGYGFVYGGYTTANGYFNDIEMYNPNTGLWSTIGSYATGSVTPVLRNDPGVITMSNGNILAIGGQSSAGPLATVQMYNPTENKWYNLSDMQTGARHQLAVAETSDGTIYAIGGNSSNNANINTVAKYDSVTDSWTNLTTLIPKNMAGHTAVTMSSASGASFADKVLVFGGYSDYTISNSITTASNLSYIFDPSASGGAGSWASTASMLTPRIFASGTLLQNGDVLAIGGENSSAININSIEEYDPASNTWMYKVPLPTAFTRGGAITLNDGSVLIAGGSSGTWDAGTANSYIYTPSAYPMSNFGAISAGGLLNMARDQFGITKITTGAYAGDIMVFGGYNDLAGSNISGTNIMEIYSPATGFWTLPATTGTTTPTRNVMLTTLPNGKILALGGYNDTFGGLSTVQQFDPVSLSWSSLSNMPSVAGESSVAQTSSGMVYVFGTWNSNSANGTADGTVMKYDYTNGTWTYATPSTSVIEGAAAVTLGSNSFNASGLSLQDKILVFGGLASSHSGNATNLAQIFDPAGSSGSGSWSSVASMLSPRAYFSGTLLLNGDVLAIGGESTVYSTLISSIEEYNPSTNSWQYKVPLPITLSREGAITLDNGSVLIVGGKQIPTQALSTTYVYNPSADSIKSAGVMSTTRYASNAVPLTDGTILVVGGEYNGVIGTVDRYNPVSNTWSAGATLPTTRYGSAMAPIAGGKAMIIGGWNNQIVSLMNDLVIYNPSTGVEATYTNTAFARQYGRAVTMYDGNVMLYGGFGLTNDNTYLNTYLINTSNPNIVTTESPMHYSRSSFGATVSNDGKTAYAIGGDTSQLTAEKFNYLTGQWSDIANMPLATSNLSAVTTSNDKILVFGGPSVASGSTLTNSVLEYNPVSNSWSYKVPLPFTLSGGDTAVLPDGSVLIAGGEQNGVQSTNAWIYTPSTYVSNASSLYSQNQNLLSQAGNMLYAREGFGTASLGDGSVLAVGGFYSGAVDAYTEQYNPTTNSWSAKAPMLNGGRYALSAVTLSDKTTVLAIGGQDNSGTVLGSVDKYDSISGTWSGGVVASMNYARMGLAATLLSDGSVLAVGGLNSNTALSYVERYYPATNNWIIETPMSTPRFGPAAVTLKDGSVLVMGGYDGANGAFLASTNSVEMYNVASNSWAYKASMLIPRGSLSAVTMPDNSVFAIGGYNGSSYVTSIEQYNPSLNSWQFRVPLPFSYGGGGAALLQDGSILITGGIQNGADSNSAWIYTPIQTISLLSHDYNAGINNGYLIGSGGVIGGSVNKLFLNIDSMLFNQDLSTVSTTTGQMHSSVPAANGTDGIIGYNTSSSLQFSNFTSLPSGMSTAVLYNNEDNKIIWGSASINGKAGTIGFASLPDRVNADNSLSNVDDFSSWGYWEATTTNPADTQEYYSGYWVSGQPTPATYIQQLINQNQTFTYTGHVLGDTINGSVKDAIVLNNQNKIDMTVNFAKSNPVNINTLQFQTSQGWSYNQSGGLTGVSKINVDAVANTQSYTANMTNALNTDVLNLQGKFYGPQANSTGGAMSGNLTGADNAQRAVQGVFKARR